MNKTLISSLLMIGISFPLMAHANLTIVNNTNHDSTSRINHGRLCSSQLLGEGGITRAKTTKNFTDMQIRLACLLNLENCVVDAYMTSDCSGPVITTVVFSVTNGIQSMTPPIEGYKVSVNSPFSVTIDGGPA